MVCIDLHRNRWYFVNLHLKRWYFINLHRKRWFFINLHRNRWYFVNLHRKRWYFVNLHRKRWFLLIFTGIGGILACSLGSFMLNISSKGLFECFERVDIQILHELILIVLAQVSEKLIFATNFGCRQDYRA